MVKASTIVNAMFVRGFLRNFVCTLSVRLLLPFFFLLLCVDGHAQTSINNLNIAAGTTYTITDDCTLSGYPTIAGTLVINGNLTITAGSLQGGGTIQVSNSVTVNSSSQITGSNTTLKVGGSLSSNSELFYIGGNVDVAGNMSVVGFTIYNAGTLKVDGLLDATGTVIVQKSLVVGGNMLTGSLTIDSNGSLEVGGSLTSSGSVTVQGNATIDGDISNTSLTIGTNGSIEVGGSLTSSGSVTVQGNATIDGDISNTSLTIETNGSIDIGGSLTSSGSVTVRGTATIDGDISNTSSLTIETNGSIEVGGSLTSSGDVTARGNTTVDGSLTATGTITVGELLVVGGNMSTVDLTIYSSSTCVVNGNFSKSGDTTNGGVMVVAGNYTTTGGKTTIYSGAHVYTFGTNEETEYEQWQGTIESYDDWVEDNDPAEEYLIIVTHPSNTTVCEGNDVSFTASASAISATSVKWQVSTDNGSTWTDYTPDDDYSSYTANGVIISILFFTPISSNNGYQYRLAALMPNNTYTYSNAATLTVQAVSSVSVSVSADPQGITCEGSSVTFTAIPSNATSPLYQWMCNGANISGATSSTYTRANYSTSDEIKVLMTSSNTGCVSNSSQEISRFSWDDNTIDAKIADYGIGATSMFSGLWSPAAQCSLQSVRYRSPGSGDSGYALAPGLKVGSTSNDEKFKAGINMVLGSDDKFSAPGVDYSIDFKKSSTTESNAFLFGRRKTSGGNDDNSWELKIEENGLKIVDRYSLFFGYTRIQNDPEIKGFRVFYVVEDGGNTTPVLSDLITTGLPTDTEFHTYRFYYDPVEGIGKFTIDGEKIWYSSDLANNVGVTPGKTLYTTGCSNLIVGECLDGGANASNVGTACLDNLSLKAIYTSSAIGTASVNYTPPLTLASTQLSICVGNDAALSVQQGSTATHYTIDWDASANSAGLVDDVINDPPNQIQNNSIPLDFSSILEGTYSGTIVPYTYLNSDYCQGTSIRFRVTVRALPSLTLTNDPLTICRGEYAKFSVETSTAAAYRVDWGSDAESAGLIDDVEYTSMPSNATISVNVMSMPTGTYSGSIVPYDGYCEGTPVSFSVIINNSLDEPSVTIDNTGYCGGSTPTFTATPVNGGDSPKYQWYQNATLISGATSSTLTITDPDTLSSTDEITVSMTSSSECAKNLVSIFTWDNNLLLKPVYGESSPSSSAQIEPNGVWSSSGICATSTGNDAGTNFALPGEMKADGIDISVDFRATPENIAYLFSCANSNISDLGYSLFVNGGNTVNAATPSVAYAVDNGSGGYQVVSSGTTKLITFSNNGFHNYRFVYNPVDGIGHLYRDGVETWSTPAASATPGKGLYWTGSSDFLLGEKTDAGNVNNVAAFDNLILKTFKVVDATASLICGSAVSVECMSDTPTCPSLLNGFNGENSNYSAGSTPVTFKVSRTQPEGVAWSFDYELTINGSATPSGPVSESCTSAEDHKEYTFDVLNVPGTSATVTFSISNVKVNGEDADQVSSSAEATILAMPSIGNFN